MGSISIPETTVSSIIQRVTTLSKDNASDAGRKALLEEARHLVAALESPSERVVRMSWFEPTIQAAVRLGIDIKLFERMIAKDSTLQTVSELAAETKCDPRLLERFMKHLAAGHIVDETGVDTYAPNAMTEILADPVPAGMIINCHEGMAMTKQRMVNYFRERNWRMPDDKTDTVFRYSAGLDTDWIPWVYGAGNEEHAIAFNNHMKFRSLAKKWHEIVPVEKILGVPDNTTKVLMVDVGGSTGHDMVDFHQKHPEYKGRLISQDMARVIEYVDRDEMKPVEIEAHDFFVPQPVKGAKAYYMRRIFHGRLDAECRKVLEATKEAMEPGYSKILVNEIVIPEIGASWYSTSIDLMMMWWHSALERRERDWVPLFESAGLKLVKIWDIDDQPEKLMELELA